jgi:LysM repeat protein
MRIPFSALVAAAVLLAAFLPATAAAQGVNLIQNGSFEGGYYKQDNITELAVPNSWRLYYVDNGTFPGIFPGQVAYRPETVIWHRAQAPDNERALFWRDGDYTLKIFKPWAPLYSALMQNVGGLQVGANYTLSVHVFVDVVDHYDGAAKVPPAIDAEHNDDVQLRLGAGQLGASWRDATAIGYGGWANAGNRSPFHQSSVLLSHTFRATASQMSVWIEMMSTAAYINNGFFLDAATLTGPTNAPASSIQGGAPSVSGPAPAGSLTLAGASSYVVRAGDTLFKIARIHKVPLSALLAANPNADARYLRVGQILIIPDPSKFYSVQRGDTLSAIALKFNTTIATLQALNGLTGTTIVTGQYLNLP